MNKFSSDLKYSGHTISFRKTLLKRIVARYEVELSNHLEGRTRLYRNREERINMKEANKMNSLKDTWFRVRGYTSTLTVPATPNGVLAEKVRNKLEKGRQPANTKTKVVEDGGRSVRGELFSQTNFQDKYVRGIAACFACSKREITRVLIVTKRMLVIPENVRDAQLVHLLTLVKLAKKRLQELPNT